MNVLIVDDESLIRNGLARKIDWASLGFSHVDTAEHGLEALDRMKTVLPDLILMDIRMPFMDGLELIKAVKDKNPEICVVIISGHEEFSYAKTALQYDAFDYILKPINLKELEKVIIKAVDYIHTMLRAQEEITDIRKHLKKSMPILKERFLLDLIYLKIGPEEALSTADQFGLEPAAFYSTAIIHSPSTGKTCQVADSPEEKHKRLEIFFNESVNSRDDAFVATISPTEYMLVISGERQDIVERALKLTIEDIHCSIEDFGLPISIFTGPVIKNLEHLHLSYEGAIINSHRAFISGDRRIFHFEDFHNTIRKEKDEGYDITAFREALTFSNRKACLEELFILRDQVKQRIPSSKLTLQILCFNIFQECKQALRKLGAELEDVSGYNPESIQTILIKPTFEEMFDQLTALVSQALDYYDKIRLEQYSFDIEKAKKFIIEHMSDEDLNLTTVAEFVNVSACHFSVIFKKKTGETFIHYLTNLRIDKARELLLNSDKKVYEVSYAVGYENPTYFSTLFKKNTGVSPFDYRRQMLISEENG